MWRDRGSAELAVTGYRNGAGTGPKVQGSPSLAPHDRLVWLPLPGQLLDSWGPPVTPGPGPEFPEARLGVGGLFLPQVSGFVTCGAVVSPLSRGRTKCG